MMMTLIKTTHSTKERLRQKLLYSLDFNTIIKKVTLCLMMEVLLSKKKKKNYGDYLLHY